jgi:hypothetical protein
MEADAPPCPELVAELQRHRDQIAAMLAGRDGDRAPTLDHDAAERAAMAAHQAAPADAEAWRPGTSDPLRDGLLVGALARPPSRADADSPPQPGAGAPAAPGTAAPAVGGGGKPAKRAVGGAGPAIHPRDHGQ